MRSLLVMLLITSLLVILCGCKERRGAIVKRDACSLVSKEEIASVQESPVNDMKSSERSDDVFRVSQCFYTTAESSKSVNLALVQEIPGQQNKRSPKDFWKEKFDPYQNEEPKTKNGDEKDQGAVPKKIDGLGDDAYWVSNRFGGVLYVLKGNAFISVGIGGTDAEEVKLEKSKTLAAKALQHVGSSCGNNEVAAPYVGDTCAGLIVQKTPPGHPEQQLQGLAPASLAIDWIAVAEPPGTNNLVFKMKATNLASVPPSSRWRVVWNSYAAQSYDPTAEQFYVGMRTDQNGNVTFDYGTIATQVVGLVIGVPTETSVGPLPGSSFNADGTITLIIPKSAIGSPAPGDLLGAINGRTFTGDTPETQNLERSTLLVDHTFVKGQRDNGHPAATYTVVGNASCGP